MDIWISCTQQSPEKTKEKKVECCKNQPQTVSSSLNKVYYIQSNLPDQICTRLAKYSINYVFGKVTANDIYFNNKVQMVSFKLLRFPLDYIVLLCCLSSHTEIFYAVSINTKGIIFQRNVFTAHYTQLSFY